MGDQTSHKLGNICDYCDVKKSNLTLSLYWPTPRFEVTATTFNLCNLGLEVLQTVKMHNNIFIFATYVVLRYQNNWHGYIVYTTNYGT